MRLPLIPMQLEHFSLHVLEIAHEVYFVLPLVAPVQPDELYLGPMVVTYEPVVVDAVVVVSFVAIVACHCCTSREYKCIPLAQQSYSNVTETYDLL